MKKKNLHITKPCYSEHILQVPWAFVKSRLITVASDFSKKIFLVALSLWTHTVSSLQSRYKINGIVQLTNTCRQYM